MNSIFKGKSVWKKTLAMGLTFTMLLSLTACGGKGGDGDGGNGSGAANADTKNTTFAATDLDMTGVKGEPSAFVLAGDRIYFYTMEWPDVEEREGNIEESDDTSAGDESGEAAGDSAEEGTSEEGEEAGSTEAEDSAGAESGKAETGDSTEAGSAETEDSAGAEAGNAEAEDSTEAGSTESGDSADAEAGSTETEAGTEASDVPVDEEMYNPTTRIYSMALDGTDIKEICTPEIDNNEYINNLIVDKDGKVLLVTSSWNEKTETNSYAVISIDDSGNVTDRTDITKNADIGQDAYISKVMSNDEGGLIIATDQSIVMLDDSFKKTGEVKSDGSYIEGVAKALDGTVLCGTTDENGAVAQVVDFKNNKLGEKYNLDISYYYSSDALMSGNGDYDFYYKDNSGVYGYSMSDKKSTKLMDYLASEVSGEQVYNIVPIDSETMLAIGWSEEGSYTAMFKKVDPSEVKDKTTITFGSMWGVDDNIRNAAIQFNKDNDKYRIEFIDYSASGEDAETKMNADIAAGKIPDIIDLSNLPLDQYVAKGILEDLTPYYEKDPDVNLDDLLPSVVSATAIDGKQYYISSSFNITTLIASKKDVGDKTGWTFDEMKELLESKGSDVRPFYSENKNDIFYSFLYGCLNDYIDWTTGKCRFDSSDFKSILEISNSGTNEEVEYDEDSPSQPSLIKSGKVLFVDGYLDVESVQLYHQMYNQDIAFIGYPSEDRQGSFFNMNEAIGIYSKSDVKEGAWEFLKTFVTMEYQAKWGHIWAVPTNQQAFEMYMKSKTTTKAYKDELGQDIEPVDSSWGWDDLEVKIGPLSADEEKLYRDLVNGTTKVNTNNYQIMDIITEEAKAYFAGQKGLDETADIIQNRVTTFVNENR